MLEVGDKYNNLTVVGITRIAKQYASRNKRPAYAVCVCDCGKKVTVRADSVEAGLVRSCGCLGKDVTAKRNKESAIAHGVKVRPVVTAELCSSWMDVKRAALATINLTAKTEPTDEWKREMILADHSPLRRLRFWVEMKNIPYSVSVHLVRHFTGVIHFVGTQRTDRCNGIDRSLLPQGIPVNHCMEINAPEVIFISKRRLCMQASPETREVWRMVVDAIGKVEPIIAEFCHPPCWWYGGRCPEMKPCGMFPKFDPTFSPVPLAKVGK